MNPALLYLYFNVWDRLLHLNLFIKKMFLYLCLIRLQDIREYIHRLIEGDIKDTIRFRLMHPSSNQMSGAGSSLPSCISDSLIYVSIKHYRQIVRQRRGAAGTLMIETHFLLHLFKNEHYTRDFTGFFLNQVISY